jgi:hypothetical protein
MGNLRHIAKVYDWYRYDPCFRYGQEGKKPCSISDIDGNLDRGHRRLFIENKYAGESDMEDGQVRTYSDLVNFDNDNQRMTFYLRVMDNPVDQRVVEYQKNFGETICGPDADPMFTEEITKWWIYATDHPLVATGFDALQTAIENARQEGYEAGLKAARGKVK